MPSCPGGENYYPGTSTPCPVGATPDYPGSEHKTVSPAGDHEEIGRTILKLEEAGVIRPTHSPYNSPVWPVKKTDGSWRMTVDYRELSKVTLPLHATELNVTYLMDQLSHELG